MTVIAAGGGFIGWLLRDYIGNLKAQIESWKSLYIDLANVTTEVTQLANRHTTLSAEEAELTRRLIRESGRERGGSRGE
jgi:hypothetical protein